MRYLSVCSGIEAASVAWHHLGWTPVGFSEIEPFPAAVLKHRFPNVPNYGDMTKFEEWPIEPGTVDLLVGGTPCQSFSVAGLRKGLEDPRGNLMLTYLAIVARFKPRWVVWENVPGVLSSNGGRDFATFLGALGQLGYGWAYRVLDAQYVRVGRWPRAVPQRRRRVFVVGCLLERCAGDWAAAAEVLAIREGLQRHLEASGKARKGAAPDAEGGARGGCWPATVASTLNHAFGDKLGLEDQHALHGAPLFVPDAVGALTAKGPEAMGAPEVDGNHYLPQRGCWWDGGQVSQTPDAVLSKGQTMPEKNRFPAVLTAGTLGNRGLRSHTELDGHGAYIPVQAQQANTLNGFDTGERDTHAVAFNWQNGGGYGNANEGLGITIEGTGPLQRCNTPAVAFNDTSATLKGGSGARGYPDPSDGNGHGIVGAPMTVRRLSCRECERLQGFPDDWTLIPWRGKPAEQCPDGPRYKALGNSMACNCMAWIGERIAAYEANGGVRPHPAAETND